MNRTVLILLPITALFVASEAFGQGRFAPPPTRTQTSSDGPMSGVTAAPTDNDGDETRRPSEGIRTWTNSQGRTIQAQFVGVLDGKVVLLKDGKRVSYPLVGLSPGDQEYVRKRLKARGQDHGIPGVQGMPNMAGDATYGPGMRLQGMPGMPLLGKAGTKLFPPPGSGFKGSLEFSYHTFSDGIERVVSATLSAAGGEGGGQPVRRTLSTYYTGSGPSDGSGSSSDSSSGAPEYGSMGDLKTVTLQEYVDGKWGTVGTTYYRYYTDANRVHRPKYVLEPEAYEKLASDPEVSDPLTAGDEKVAEYATKYLEYDESGNLVSSVAQEPFTPPYGDRHDVPAEEHECSPEHADESAEKQGERDGPGIPTPPTPPVPEASSGGQAGSSSPEIHVERDVCGNCGKQVSGHRGPSDRCPHCGATLGIEETVDGRTVDASGKEISRWWYTIGGAGAVAAVIGVAIAFFVKLAGSRE
ncbi:MAG TPA: SHD1 domain-containing protein [Thermoguttaceae bacterium]|nr:SHD1 domain-containing protein [Thermoguttaceae bacterium]